MFNGKDVQHQDLNAYIKLKKNKNKNKNQKKTSRENRGMDNGQWRN
jgi:hypothetical protein